MIRQNALKLTPRKSNYAVRLILGSIASKSSRLSAHHFTDI